MSFLVAVADVRTSLLEPVRRSVTSLLTPVQWLSRAPFQLATWSDDIFSSRADLQESVDSLNHRVLLLERKAQKLASVTAELNRLRALLNASRIIDEGVAVTELIGISPDPTNQYITVNKGMVDQVYVGQAVLDAYGLMGQVIEVNEFTSRVLLISDGQHAIPVQVNRNGVRAIALGTGSTSSLQLVNVPDTADIEVGDLLVSSGLGGRFPQGYPVGTVAEVDHDPGQSFANVSATPAAKLNKSRLLLLVSREDALEEPKVP